MRAAAQHKPPAVPPAISLHNVSFAYGAAPVLEEVTLSVSAGQFMSIIGPNGGGKTTLLKIILGLLTPQSGTVRLFGQAPAAARRQVGYVPQYLHYDPQFPVTVLDVVLMGRLGTRLGGPYTRQDRAAALQALEELQLSGLSSRPFSGLSGGQRQRALIARALAVDPRLLLLDEPTANVDTQGEAKLWEILKMLNQRMTILLVSHDVGMVSNLVAQVICVNRRVVVHPTRALSAGTLTRMYQTDLRAILHDTQCFDEEPPHG